MKKLSLAIYWHMHQPVYEIEGTYLMPWSRLHAVKDYLDMALFLDRFPRLKLNFNVVPALMDSVIDEPVYEPEVEKTHEIKVPEVEDTLENDLFDLIDSMYNKED